MYLKPVVNATDKTKSCDVKLYWKISKKHYKSYFNGFQLIALSLMLVSVIYSRSPVNIPISDR